MNFNLKDRPLAIQIWIILGLVLGVSSILLMIIIPLILKFSFTEEMFARIKDSQEHLLNEGFNNINKDDWQDRLYPDSEYKEDDKKHPPPPFRVVEHILINDQETHILNRNSRKPESDFIREIKNNIENADIKIESFTSRFENGKYIYVMRKVNIEGETNYLVSYLKRRYREDLVRYIFVRIMGTLIFVLFISWIASIYIARYLTRPLLKLQNKVKEIARRNWDKPVSINRDDEIGKLGKTIDWMRCQLIEQNEKQQSFLQQVSHELKTPIMVIKSYVQSIQDGIYPKGDLEDSVQVIEDETGRLEKRVHSLLNLTKLNYFSTHTLKKNDFNLTALIKNKVNSLGWRRSELKWQLELEELIFKGDKDKITVMLENIFDNQLRYAENMIEINLCKTTEDANEFVLIHIWNDGPEIISEVKKDIFKKYEKGSDGKFGLGLAIVKIIIDMHKGQIWTKNQDGGVSFYIKLPID